MSYYVSTDIFATQARQDVLDLFGIKYVVDCELNFMFKSEEDKQKAFITLKNACEL